MRKRVIIGAIAVVGIGVGVYVLSQPKRGSVEWHKSEYLKFASGGSQIGKWICDYGPEALAQRLEKLRDQHIVRHRDALVRLGYLARTTLVVSNAAVDDIADRVLVNMCDFYPLPPRRWEPKNVDYQFFSYEKGTNFIEIFCNKDDVREWQRVIAKADVNDTTWNEITFQANSLDEN